MDAVHLVRLQSLPYDIIERFNRISNVVSRGEGWYIFCAPEGMGIDYLCKLLNLSVNDLHDFVCYEEEAWYKDQDDKQKEIEKFMGQYPEARFLG